MAARASFDIDGLRVYDEHWVLQQLHPQTAQLWPVTPLDSLLLVFRGLFIPNPKTLKTLKPQNPKHPTPQNP